MMNRSLTTTRAAVLQKSPTRKTPRSYRVAMVEGFFLLFGMCLVGRLIYIQVVQHGKYQSLARMQHHSAVPITAQRGVIYDRNLNLLALNEACISIGVDLRQVKDRRKLADKVGKTIGEPSAKLYERMKTDRSFVWLKRRVDADLEIKIKALKLEGIRIEKDARRRYPHREIAAHVLGFTDIDNHGIAGIEQMCDSLLAGKDGRRFMQRDAIGNRLANLGSPDVPAVNGKSVVLTIDNIIQTIATEEMRLAMDQFDASSGMVLVTRPMTGEILAMVCEPSYDPNQPANYSNATRRNRLVTDLFEPGSTFKLVTYAAVLQEKIKHPSDVIFCENGAYKYMGQTITDHGERYGNLAVREVLSHSSNIGTFKLAKAAGSEKIYRYARDFGFGMATGFGEGEVNGVLKSPAEWSGFTIAAMAMGYEVSITALQLAMAYGAVANGGLLLQPKLVAAVGDAPDDMERFDEPQIVRRVLSSETARTLSTMLEGVVNEGTATNAKIEGLRIAGKTGTARKPLVGARGYSRSDYIASFVGFFPAEKPSHLVFVMLENPRTTYWGGMVAAPTFKNIAQRILIAQTQPKHSPQFTETFTPNSRETIMETRNIVVPDLTNRQRGVAEKMLDELGLEAEWDGDGDFILGQMPPAGSAVFPNAKVTLQLFEVAPRAKQQMRMPQLVGLSLRQALQQLSLLGIDAHVVGNGRVTQQHPAAGTAISSNTRCELRCQMKMPVAREVVAQ
ncbi:PASTA domain-containing protein [candidate division KSB1 bacterium]|nr:PASTA domain-containing protein [candidate division KSB1 bacterium]